MTIFRLPALLLFVLMVGALVVVGALAVIVCTAAVAVLAAAVFFANAAGLLDVKTEARSKR